MLLFYTSQIYLNTVAF